MKKLAILVLIWAFLTFTAAKALAHDDDKDFKHFNGTYEMSASGSCIHSEGGYSSLVDTYWGQAFETQSGVVYAGPTVSSGTWVFKKMGREHIPILCTLQSLPRFHKLLPQLLVGFVFSVPSTRTQIIMM